MRDGAMIQLRKLADYLEDILEFDRRGDYAARECAVLSAVGTARRIGYDAGFRIDPKEPTWPVAFIQLPTGQVSWHMPGFPFEWDGHGLDEKNARVKAFIASMKVRNQP